jgi:hypothetical protein
MIEFRATQSKQHHSSWDYLADCKSALQQTASLRYAAEAFAFCLLLLKSGSVSP